jgi:hypothetical protein
MNGGCGIFLLKKVARNFMVNDLWVGVREVAMVEKAERVERQEEHCCF